jgi:hypothetical protein
VRIETKSMGFAKSMASPFDATGEKIHDGGLWRVYEFTRQLDAMQFWDRFEGRWLRGNDFHYPERPKNLPAMVQAKN